MATMSSAAVEVISMEIIKPTTPTPYQLRNFNISLFDQYMPPNYTPVILFYASSAGNSKLHDDLGLLKISLSETLVHFYPMAGRLKDNMVVDCNDQGVDFCEVKIKAKMCDFMMKPDEFPLSLLLPSDVVSVNLVKEAQVIVQVNMFDCGGTAISLCISHKIADACTISTFIRNWAGNTYSARCGGAPTGNQSLLPSFDAASLFPPSEQLVCPSEVPPTPLSDSRGDKSVSKRFVFDAAKITTVREKLQMHDNYKCSSRPTRVDVVTALVWKAAIKSAPGVSTVNHVVSFRKKIEPPLPDASVGNLCAVVATAVSPRATATSTNDEIEVQLAELVAQLRGEKCKVKGDKGCIEKLFLSCISGEEDDSVTKNGDVEDETSTLWIGSWSKFGFYDADFGWGKPVWVTTDLSVVEPNQNVICMIDTKCGEGLEVSAKFLENDMAKFELHLSEILKVF